MRRNFQCLLFGAGFFTAIYLHINGYTSTMRGIIAQNPTPTMSYILPTFKGNHSVHFLDIVCTFPVLDSTEGPESRYSHVNKVILDEREVEFVYSLSRNLNHPAVATVHLLSHKPDELFNKLTNQYGVNLRKAIFYKSSENQTYQEMLIYASRFLQGRFVLVMNADNYIGDGFTDVNLTYMRTSKIIYALTRRFPVSLQPKCNFGYGSYCEDGSTYLGSHQAFLFYLDYLYPNDFLKELNFSNDVLGSENVLIWAFKSILKYPVLNPCKILHIHHLHCSSVRVARSIRVNGEKTTGMAAFTSSLYVEEEASLN